jgi:hypothetical protein
MNEAQQHPLVVSEREVALMLGVSVSALRLWRSQRVGPPFARIRRRVVYLIKDLEAFLGSNRVETEPR